MTAAAEPTGYVVESDMGRGATARVYVATRERADLIAGQGPGRTVREIPISAMPEKARANLTSVARGAACGVCGNTEWTPIMDRGGVPVCCADCYAKAGHALPTKG